MIAARFGITAPYWVGFVVAVLVSASTWRVFNRAAVAQAYAAPAWSATPQPGRGQRPAAGLRCGYRWEAPVRPEPGAQAASASLRASRADRERVIDLLKAAFVQGRLARDEFDARIGQVLASRTYAELAAATASASATATATTDIPAAGAGVILVANVGMLAALFIGSPVAVVLVAVFTVIGAILTIAAMIVAP